MTHLMEKRIPCYSKSYHSKVWQFRFATALTNQSKCQKVQSDAINTDKLTKPSILDQKFSNFDGEIACIKQNDYRDLDRTWANMGLMSSDGWRYQWCSSNLASIQFIDIREANNINLPGLAVVSFPSNRLVFTVHGT